MRILLLALTCCASLQAQQALVDLSLAEDSAKSGPPAWTYVRERILVKLPEWPQDLDPLTAIHVGISRALVITFRGGEPPRRYLAARIHLPSGTQIVANCDFDGLEGWQIREGGALEPRLCMILDLLDLKFHRNLLSLDLGALTGNLMAGSISGDPLHSLLTSGAVECGTMRIGAFFEAGRWRIAGQSAGGLLLPAALALLAEWQKYPPSDEDRFASRPIHEIDRWLLLASAARGQEREEAARQLARFDDDHAQSKLEQLLHSDGAVHQAAIVSLVRRSETGTRRKMAREFGSSSEFPTDDKRSSRSNAFVRPGIWTFLVLSLIAICKRLISSPRN